MSDKNNQSVSIYRRWLIWFLPTLFMFYQYGVQSTPGLEIHYLQKYYLINNVEITFLSTFYILTYMLCQVPSGIIIDRYDVRKVLTAAVLIFALGNFCIFISNYYYSYLAYVLGRLIMGVAASTSFISSIYLANIWLSEKSFKIALSLTTSFAMLGVLIIDLIFSFMLTFMNWPQLLFLNFIFCLLLAIILFIFIKDVKSKKTTRSNNYFSNLSVLFKNKNLWLCGVLAGGIFSNIVVLTNVWRIDFLENIYHLNALNATIDNGFSILGFIVGTPILGMLATRIKNTFLLILFCTILLFCALIICQFIIEDLSIKIIFYFLIGFFTSSMVLAFTVIKNFVSENMLGTATGLVSMIEMMIGMALIPITGKLMDHFHGNFMLATAPVIIATFFAVIAAFLLWRIEAKKHALS